MRTFPVLPNHFERDPKKLPLLNLFKEQLRGRHTVAQFTDASDLAVQVAADLGSKVESLQQDANLSSHRRILHRGVEAWNRWREECPDVEPNLEAADLSGCNLVGYNLQNANLLDADLRKCLLIETDLRGAKVRGAKIGKTVFANTALFGAQGLDSCVHYAPSMVDFLTLSQSGPVPVRFLFGCGLPERLISYLPSLLFGAAIEFYSVFICYTHADKGFARHLHDVLQGHGVRCWLDEKQLLPGDTLYDKIDESIRLFDKVLLCCSRESLTSWWVDNEIQKALEKEHSIARERGQRVNVLIPLNIDGYMFSGVWKSGLSTLLLSRLAADFSGWDTDHTRFETQVNTLLRALKAEPSIAPSEQLADDTTPAGEPHQS